MHGKVAIEQREGDLGMRLDPDDTCIDDHQRVVIVTSLEAWLPPPSIARTATM